MRWAWSVSSPLSINTLESYCCNVVLPLLLQGKTVEVLALMLQHPRPAATVVPTDVLTQVTYTASVGIHCFSGSTPHTFLYVELSKFHPSISFSTYDNTG